MTPRSETVLVGLDAGGTYVKATAFDLESGRSATSALPVRGGHPRPGQNERDADALWDAAGAVVRRALDDVGPHGGVLAVGVTAHGNGAYLVDPGGRPTRAAVQASDTRASELVEAWVASGVTEQLRPTVWNGLWPGQPGPLLAWLQRHEPDTLARSTALLMCGDYLRARLTGRLRAELTAWSCNGLLDSATRTISGRALETYGIEGQRRLIPEFVQPLEQVGEITPDAAAATGLGVGTPVVAGAVDNVAMQLGAGVTDSSRILVGAGTWSINQLLVPESDMTMDGPLGRVEPYAACLAVPDGLALLIEASATSASTLGWALHTILRQVESVAEQAGQSVYTVALERVAALDQRADAPMFLPYLDGSRDEPAARGAWVGLSSSDDEDELLRATVEGICFEHRRHVERLSRGGGAGAPLRLAGGAGRSPVWAQLFADTTRRTVEVSPVEEIGAVGAAVIAGAATGAFTSLADGVSYLNPRTTAFEPAPGSEEHHERRYERYLRWAAVAEHDARTAADGSRRETVR